MSETPDPTIANVYGRPNKGPYILGVIAIVIAVLAWAFSGPSEDDIESAVRTAKTELMGRIATKADSANAYANLAANSDVEGLRGEVTALSGQVIEVRDEVLGHAEVTGNDSSGYKVEYTPGLRDLIRGRRDTVEVVHESDTLRTVVRIAAMPSGAEMQQMGHDQRRLHGAVIALSQKAGGVTVSDEIREIARRYHQAVTLRTSTRRSQELFNQTLAAPVTATP